MAIGRWAAMQRYLSSDYEWSRRPQCHRPRALPGRMRVMQSVIRSPASWWKSLERRAAAQCSSADPSSSRVSQERGRTLDQIS